MHDAVWMKRKPVIGVLMDFFTPAIIEGAGAYARENDLALDPRWSIRADWMPDDSGWDIALVHIVDQTESTGRIERLGIPIVTMGYHYGKHFPKVLFEHAAAGAAAIHEFQRIHIRRVAISTQGRDPVDLRSRKGVFTAARRLGVEIAAMTPWTGDNQIEAAAENIVDKMEELGADSGYYTPHAGVAYSVARAMQRRNIRFPIIVTDKDAQKTAEMSSVPLTTVVPDFWQQGYEAARMAHELLDGRVGRGARVVRRVKACRIVRRESTGQLTARDPAVVKALHGIRESSLPDLTVENLVRYVGVSRRTLEQRFKKEVRTTLHQAILQRQMDEATRLLQAGGLTVSEVADTCGFSSVHYFSAAFKRERGVTPGSIRRGPGAGSHP